MSERSGFVENWLNELSLIEASNIIDKLKK